MVVLILILIWMNYGIGMNLCGTQIPFILIPIGMVSRMAKKFPIIGENHAVFNLKSIFLHDGEMENEMKNLTLDITGKMCPFCLLMVKKHLAKLVKEDVLIVKCDHPPAATETIPYAMKKAGYPCEMQKIRPGLWELRIRKK